MACTLLSTFNFRHLTLTHCGVHPPINFQLSTLDTFRSADVLKAAVRGNFDPAQFRAVDEMIMGGDGMPQWLKDMLNDTHEQGWPSLLLELAGKAGKAGYLFASEDVKVCVFLTLRFT